eukprot:GHVQ01008682.1.p1 GENE.GHVQ01008682.1~~GHVQ01008682.1.p1  ORF type:complete len:183 (-),score=4.00 GHVQ01008682.1:521-1069(-)
MLLQSPSADMAKSQLQTIRQLHSRSQGSRPTNIRHKFTCLHHIHNLHTTYSTYGDLFSDCAGRQRQVSYLHTLTPVVTAGMHNMWLSYTSFPGSKSEAASKTDHSDSSVSEDSMSSEQTLQSSDHQSPGSRHCMDVSSSFPPAVVFAFFTASMIGFNFTRRSGSSSRAWTILSEAKGNSKES